MKKILLGDCFDRIKNIQDKSINFCIIDPPYNQTAISWDKSFDNNIIITEVKRVLTKTGVCIIFGREPELSFYRIAGLDIFKYDLIWKKSRKNGYLQCKKKPLQQTEKIAVFSNGGLHENSPNRMNYYPQFLRPCFKQRKSNGRPRTNISGSIKGKDIIQTDKEYPTDIIEVSQEYKPYHVCEKPIELFEYLILTYTKLGNTILDLCFGSGNSLIAAKGLNRNFIGIEKEKDHYERLINIL